MELKPGYKQTEVGVIPEDWEVREVAKFAKIITGPFGTLLKASEYTQGDGVPQISVGEIGDGFFRVDEHTSRIPPHVVKRLPQYLLRSGDVVFGRKGAVERSALVTESEHGWFLGSDGICVRPAGDCHPPYLAAQFRSREIKTWLLNNAIGTTMPSLNQGVLSHVRVPFAPQNEQSAIATALSDVDALLATQDALIEKKRAIKQGAMQELLTGKRRLSGFSQAWTVSRLGDIAKIQRGASPRPIDSPLWFDDNSDVGWVRISDVTNSGMYLEETTQRLSQDGIRHSRPVSSGNLIMSICATVGRPIITRIDTCIHDGFVVFDDLRASQKFLYYVLKWIEPNWSKHGQTGSQMNLNTGLINRTALKLPAVDEQEAIAAVLSAMDADILALEQKREKVMQLKQGMMQELLTGKTRLVAPC